MADEVRFATPPGFIFKKNEDNKHVAPLNSVKGATIGYDLERVTFNENYLKKSQEKGKLRIEEDHWTDGQGVYYPHPESHKDYGCTLGWFKDCPFPSKGFPFPQALYAVNFSKRIFLAGIRIPSKMKWYSPMSWITAILDAYSSTCRFMIEPFLLSSKNYSPLSAELRKTIYIFLIELGMNNQSADDFAEIFATNIQYDNAYYLRLEDLLSETTKEKLIKNPKKEIKRLIGLSGEREKFKQNSEKFYQVSKLISLAFYIPGVKKSFRKAIEKSDFEKFQWDRDDIHHTLLWDDYQFRGIPIEERQAEYIRYYTENPPFPPRRYI